MMLRIELIYKLNMHRINYCTAWVQHKRAIKEIARISAGILQSLCYIE